MLCAISTNKNQALNKKPSAKAEGFITIQCLIMPQLKLCKHQPIINQLIQQYYQQLF